MKLYVHKKLRGFICLVGPNDDQTANARLIASAPDLLEACKEALENGVWTGENSTPKTLQQAISKAEGGT